MTGWRMPPEVGVDLPSESPFDISASSADLCCGNCGKSGRPLAELALTADVYVCRPCALRILRRANKYGAKIARAGGPR
jgi:hypothetical protein